MATLTDAYANHIYYYTKTGVTPPDLTGGVFLRLFTASPTVAGLFTNEVTGGSYTGQDISDSVAVPSAGVGTSNADINFTGMPAVTVSHWGLASTAAGTTAGSMVEFGAFSSPIDVTAASTFTVLAGDLDSTAD